MVIRRRSMSRKALLHNWITNIFFNPEGVYLSCNQIYHRRHQHISTLWGRGYSPFCKINTSSLEDILEYMNPTWCINITKINSGCDSMRWAFVFGVWWTFSVLSTAQEAIELFPSIFCSSPLMLVWVRGRTTPLTGHQVFTGYAPFTHTERPFRVSN